MASPDAGAQERTEQPTLRRRAEARRKGQVAKSPDLGPAVLLLGALGMLALGGAQLLADGLGVLRRGLAVGPPATDLTPAAALALVGETALAAARVVAPLVLLPAALSVGAQLAQTRLVVASARLAPDWSRIDPLKGLGRLASLRSLAELLKALLKLAIIGGVAYLALRAEWPALMALGQGGPAALLATLGRVVGRLWLGVGVAYLVLAGLDYAYQWWEHERGLRMTRQEVREDTRHTEGDPLLRARLRTLHRQRASRRMLVEVRRADVVIRNPTRYAVALRYDGGRMAAPRVVAKGARLVARTIIDVARAAGVPVVENPPLARALYAAVRVGQDIPPALYRAVAEVLAHVYALRGRRP